MDLYIIKYEKCKKQKMLKKNFIKKLIIFTFLKILTSKLFKKFKKYLSQDFLQTNFLFKALNVILKL